MPHPHTRPLSGMTGFTLIWIGQLASLLGTGMTRFAIAIWAYTQTESATVLTLTTFFAFAPLILLSPFAGALVDRWNRKQVMMISDLAAGGTTIILLILFSAGQLQIWHLYVMAAIASAFEAFQFPAFSAALTMMLKKEQYTRANGMLSTAQSASTIAAPILAGILLGFGDMRWILTIDIVTFSLAVGLIALVHIPQPVSSIKPDEEPPSIWADAAFGFRYIWSKRPLFGMQMMFLIVNLILGFGIVLIAPYILARTDGNEVMLGTVQSMNGLGGLVGGILISVWGGPKNRVHGVLLGMIGSALFGWVILGSGESLIWWAIGAFFASFFIPILNGSNQSIWQSKVPANLQGRIFATRRLLAQITFPIAMLAAGPLADQVFEPAFQTDTEVAALFGPIVGVGSGAGIGLIILMAGIIGTFAPLLGYFIPAVREIETRIPDAINEAEPPTQERPGESLEPVGQTT